MCRVVSSVPFSFGLVGWQIIFDVVHERAGAALHLVQSKSDAIMDRNSSIPVLSLSLSLS